MDERKSRVKVRGIDIKGHLEQQGLAAFLIAILEHEQLDWSGLT